MKRLFCVVFAVLTVFLLTISASAVDYGCTVDPVADAVYLENLDTGAVVYQKQADKKMYPASTTKIMTYAVVADRVADLDGTQVAIKDGLFDKIDPDSTVMGLSEYIGDSFSVRDLLYGMMLPSGNDAALVLADYVGSGISGFVDMMNAKAAELGCKGTHFTNPHGLYDPDHYTTAHDLAVITKYAMNTQSFMEVTNTVEYTPKGFEYPIKNTNYMLYPQEQAGNYYYPYTRGIKTGYLDEAGKCLVTTAVKDGFTYLCVELGTEYTFEEDINYAMLDAIKFYDWAFTDLGKQTVYGPSDTVKSIPVKYSKGDAEVAAIPEKEIIALLPNKYNKDLVVVDIKCEDSVDAPVSKGDVLGTVSVRYDDMDLGTTNVVAAADVERSEFKYIVSRIADFTSKHIALVILVIVLIIALIIAIAAVRARNKRAQLRERARRRYRD